jgi:ATP-dependent Lon protease
MERSSSENDAYEAPAILAEDAIIFPNMEVSMVVRDPRGIAATVQAFREHNLIVLIPASTSQGVVGAIGTLVLLRRTVPAEGSGAQSLWKGLWRVKVDRIVGEEPYVRVRFSRAVGSEDLPSRSALMKAVFDQIDEFVRAIPEIPSEIISYLKDVNSPGKLADLCAYSPFFSHQERLDLLRTLDPEERLKKVNGLFGRQLDNMKRLAKTTSIPECATCIELADRALELGPSARAEVAHEFLEHVVREHPDEMLGLLVEKYGPAFMRRRALK